jgi:hypothetical protein
MRTERFGMSLMLGAREEPVNAERGEGKEGVSERVIKVVNSLSYESFMLPLTLKTTRARFARGLNWSCAGVKVEFCVALFLGFF